MRPQPAPATPTDLMLRAALMISLMRGTPSVTFMEATPAKWNVLSVIWVPGSPMDWAPTAPTVDPVWGDGCACVWMILHALR